VALDKSPEDARPYIERASPTHPALIDSEHVVAHRYGIINISSVVWIDENGRIVRPPLIEYGTNMFKDFHGKDAGPHLDQVRAWVRTGALPMSREEASQSQLLPTRDEQLARAEFGLAWHLWQRGDREAAQRHFQRAGELAPHDWTIRRGAMPIQGKDPMGPDFFDLFREWMEAGRPDYRSLAQERRGDRR